jgi:hypothetical protein
VTCVLWNGLYHVTGTDIVRALVFRFEVGFFLFFFFFLGFFCGGGCPIPSSLFPLRVSNGPETRAFIHSSHERLGSFDGTVISESISRPLPLFFFLLFS